MNGWLWTAPAAVLVILLFSGASTAFTARPVPAVHRKIASLAFSPDGKRLAAGSYREVLLLDPGKDGIAARLPGIGGTANAVCFSPDGSILAVGGGQPAREGEIQLWDWRARRLIRTLHAHSDAVLALAFRPDGAWLAAGSYDHLVSLHGVRSEGPPRILKDHTDAVYSVAFNSDGTRLASAAGDRTVKVWDPNSGKRLFTLSEATAELYTLTFRPDGRQLAAGGVDKMIRVWDVSPDHGSLAESAFAHDGAVIRLLYTRDGKSLVSAGEDRAVKAWDAAQLTSTGQLPKQPDWPLALALDPSGTSLAVGRFDGSVALYQAPAGPLRKELLGRG